jgi:Ca-activated chloride channel family protein
VNKRLFTFFSILLALSLASAACLSSSPAKAPRNAEIVQVVASTNLQSWLDEVADQFNREKIKSTQGKPYYIELVYKEAGLAISENMTEEFTADLWIPDSLVWAELMAERGEASYLADCQSVVESPLIIAMWQPLAEALGWPGRELGWLDIGSLAADPSAWAYYSGGQYGPTLRVGHTHPGLSGSGAATLLAVVHAAQARTDAVTAVEIQGPIVQASVSAFEASVSTFSKSTSDLWQLMTSRGSTFLGAAVLYENLVFEQSDQQPAIVPIYPYEGTFVAEFPACIQTGAAEEKQYGALLFRQRMLSADGQESAQSHGLRVVSDVSTVSPFEGSSFTLEQPKIVYENPSVEAVYAVQELWQSARKPVNLVLVIDTSGSMSGDKIASVRTAAIDFIEAMGDGDFVSILVFSGGTRVTSLVYGSQVGESRQQIVQAIGGLQAAGATPLYDSIGEAARIIAETNSSSTSNAMVVLTDGMDTSSENFSFGQQLIDQATANDTTIYTIAFGDDADEQILQDLAWRANGNFYLGDQANISEIYGDMSVIFGGSAGIGR